MTIIVENCILKIFTVIVHSSVFSCLQLVSFDYGMKGENPVDKVYFYRKSAPNTPIKISQDEVG